MPDKEIDLELLKEMIVHPRIGEIFLQQRKITLQELTEGLAEQEKNNIPIGRILIDKGFVTENDLVELLSVQKNIGTLLKECYNEMEKLKSEGENSES